MGNKEVTQFFENNAQSWVLNGYNDDGYNYPTALHRSRIIKKILKSKKNKLKIVDLGCGAGNVTIMLAKLGHKIIGIDESKSMIEMAEKEKSKLSKIVKKNITFINESITNNTLQEEEFDVCISMGVIGYLEKDEILFQIAKKLLNNKGLFIVSCRNRLFNMQSLTFRTINEIKNKNAEELINELLELYDAIPTKNINQMVKKLKKNVYELSNDISFNDDQKKSPHEAKGTDNSYKPFYEPRQHTPKQIDRLSKEIGFEPSSFFGVHPHLLDPNLNKLLPPKLFNQLSSCLEAFEDLPISLVFSSVFIGVFKNK